jgi:glycosyltransferase involved in cell wall biosynthesis
MKVWLITAGEPLPLPGSRERLWRTGLLAETLVRRGHEVLWWASTFDHFRKVTCVPGEPLTETSIGAKLQFLRGRGYRRNVSLSRLVNHAQIAHRFKHRSRSMPRPDIILCSYPTIELSAAAVYYARAGSVPILLDVRDLWPDIFLSLLPSWARPAGRVALASMFRQGRRALVEADGLLAVSQGYLEWGLERAGRGIRPTDHVFPLGYLPAEWTEGEELVFLQKIHKLGIDPDRFLVTFAGTFGRSYDLATVIAAARKIAAEGKQVVQFVLCGAGERQGEWRELAGALPNVRFTGWLTGGELSCLLKYSKVGLAAYSPHAPQGIPNKVIEYFAAGLPVLCSLPGEARKLLEEHGCGFYYPAGDATALAARITELSSEPAKRDHAGARARAVFAAHYSAVRVYGSMADHLEYCAGVARSDGLAASAKPSGTLQLHQTV